MYFDTKYFIDPNGTIWSQGMLPQSDLVLDFVKTLRKSCNISLVSTNFGMIELKFDCKQEREIEFCLGSKWNTKLGNELRNEMCNMVGLGLFVRRGCKESLIVAS